MEAIKIKITRFDRIMNKLQLDLEFEHSLLLKRLKSDDENAFAEIVRHFTPALFRKAYQLTRNHDDAEDLLQDLFSNIWERRHGLSINSSLKSYLFVSLRHRFLRKLMRAELHEKAMDHVGNHIQQIEFSVIDMLEAADVQATIADAVGKLPEHMQQIFLLRGGEHSIKEIAAALGLAEQTIKSYNMELKRRIKEAILTRHPDVSHLLLLSLISKFFNN